MSMSNISVRKEEQSRTPATTTTEWDPSRVMKQFFGWDPFRELSPFIRAEANVFSPAFEVKETKEGYEFKADVPGVKESDLQITLSGNRLTLSGKRDAEKEERAQTYYTYERSYGSFTRTFSLPEGIDAKGIHADLRDGVLTMHVPRKPEAQPVKIAVKSSTAKA
jgi:HSP20 family protein